MIYLKRIILIILIGISLIGCSTRTSEKKPFEEIYKFTIKDFNENLELNDEPSLPSFNENGKNKNLVSNKIVSSKPPVITINEKVFNKNQLKDDMQIEFKKDSELISINVEDIPINKFIKLIYEQILGLNYTIDNTVINLKTKVTLNMVEETTHQKLFLIAERILNSNGVVIELDEKTNNYFIKKGKTKGKVNPLSKNIFYGKNLPDEIQNSEEITIFIPTYYIEIASINTILKRHYLSKSGQIIPIKAQQVILIHDKAKNIREILSFLEYVDVPSMINKKTELITLDFLDVNAFYERLKSVLPHSGVKIVNSIKKSGVVIEVIPEINALFILSEKQEWVDIIDYWKNKLDTLESDNEEKKLFIYKPKNRKAEELQKVVEDIISKSSTIVTSNASQKKTQKTKSVKDKKIDSTQRADVIVDVERNTIIFSATPKEYKSIYNILKKLDILPKQVLVEIIIAELTLSDSLQYGLEWYLRNEGNRFSSTLSTQGNLGIGGGMVGSLVKSSGDLNILLNAFAGKNLINVLSSPKLVVLDNQSASINVGTEVPIVTSTTTTQDNTSANEKTTNRVQYRNTGTILNVTPTVHSDGTMTLEISQTISEAQTNSLSDISSPLILNRTIKTNVVLKSNQSLLLGGLIRENKSDTVTKVPFFGDLPFVGNFFKSTSKSVNKTELMIVVKPIILNNIEKTDAITNRFLELISK